MVAALRSKRGASYQLIGSVALALEYEDVLKRKGLLPISEEEADEFLDYGFKVSNPVPSVLRRRPSLRDPDDERILQVAVECRAVIVTFNKRHFAGADRFGIPIQTPGEFMRALEKANERER
ncbi:MAG: PIN domain-containing protein [Bryobacteraceae bacterium]